MQRRINLFTDKYDVIGFPVGGGDLRIDCNGGELGDDADGSDDNRATKKGWDCLVHQGVGLDEVQVYVRQRFCVVAAGSWSWARHLSREIELKFNLLKDMLL